MLPEVPEEITLLFPFQAVTLSVFKHLLFFLKPYLLGEGDGVLVLLPFLSRAGMNPHIQIKGLLLAQVLHLVFKFSFHRPGFIYDMVAVIIIDGRFAPAEIILQPEARASI